MNRQLRLKVRVAGGPALRPGRRAALLDAVDLFAEVDAPYEGALALLVLARFMDIHLRRLGRSAWTGR
jgi:hypothetical protein